MTQVTVAVADRDRAAVVAARGVGLEGGELLAARGGPLPHHAARQLETLGVDLEPLRFDLDGRGGLGGSGTDRRLGGRLAVTSVRTPVAVAPVGRASVGNDR